MTHFEVLLNFGDNDFLFPLSRDNSAIFPVITRDNSGNFALSLEVFYDHSDKKKPAPTPTPTDEILGDSQPNSTPTLTPNFQIRRP